MERKGQRKSSLPLILFAHSSTNESCISYSRTLYQFDSKLAPTSTLGVSIPSPSIAVLFEVVSEIVIDLVQTAGVSEVCKRGIDPKEGEKVNKLLLNVIKFN